MYWCGMLKKFCIGSLARDGRQNNRTNLATEVVDAPPRRYKIVFSGIRIRARAGRSGMTIMARRMIIVGVLLIWGLWVIGCDVAPPPVFDPMLIQQSERTSAEN